MSNRIAKTIRVIEATESQPKPVAYWRTRPVEERLAETLALHREGNALFKGGNPPFVFELKVRYVADSR